MSKLNIAEHFLGSYKGFVILVNSGQDPLMIHDILLVEEVAAEVWKKVAPK